ncbi:MAG: hypothetical protein JW816_04525 [Candidatus Buchananbacteria bacterium]|nr:hypothetical protein [Candidatus Buchananbacteria bacterium]
MSDQNSILDKIIQSKQIKDASQFDPSETVASLFKNLSNKEQDILNRRFGLAGKGKQTLEEIGKYYEITRERIRQIESGTIRKLKELQDFKQQIETAENNVFHLLEKYGGLMEENHLINELLSYSDSTDSNRQASHFILENLLSDKLEKVKQNDHLLPGWKLPTVSLDLVEQSLIELVKMIEEEKQLIGSQSLADKFANHENLKDHQKHLLNVKLGGSESENIKEDLTTILQSLLTISRKLDQNILGEWGLNEWQTIKPKRMSDKAYLVLRKAGKPLHFTEITNLINESSFDKKKAYPATIHNELILDDRYVLVGRGIYALKEWGYQAGTVIDIITDILKKAATPLTKEEVVEKVLAQRLVRKSTIYLALTNKNKIKKLSDGRYTLA